MSELTGIRRAYDAIEGPNEEAVATARELLLDQVGSTETTGASLRKRRAGVVASLLQSWWARFSSRPPSRSGITSSSCYRASPSRATCRPPPGRPTGGSLRS